MDCGELSLNEALTQLDGGGSRLLAGGTDYYPALNDARPDGRLIDLRHVEGLGNIEKHNGYWRIGAAVTWSDIINAPLPACFNCLQQAAREVGSVQIQNSATVVGNICNASPAADGVPALLALNAQIEVTCLSGSRLSPLSAFITGVRKINLSANEIVTAIVIPDTLSDDVSEFVKLGARHYLVISIVMCASRIQVDSNNVITDAAIAVGACSPVAQRLSTLENALLGQTCADLEWPKFLDAKHYEALSPIDDVRASAQYRIHALSILLQRQIEGIRQKIISGSTS